jgi:small subunit ribosomal protein S6
MNRKYEGIIVLNTKGKDESIESMIEAVRGQIEEQGVTVESTDQLGRREFAYNARHLEAGFYVRFVFEAEPEAIDKIKTHLKLNNDVFLQHYQRLD